MGREKAAPKKRPLVGEPSSEPYNCYNYIPVVKKRKIKRKSFSEAFYKVHLSKNEFYIGFLLIGTTDNVLPDDFSTCKVSFKQTEEDEAETLIFQFDTVYFLVTSAIESSFFKDLVTSQIFSFEFCIKNEELFINIYFTTLPLQKFTNKIGTTIKILFKLLYKIESNTAEDYKNQFHCQSEIVRLYNKIKETRVQDNIPGGEIQHPFLKPVLRPYQIQAVKWMLHREKTDLNEEDVLHPLYTPVLLKSDQTIYFDKYTGYVCLEKPTGASSHRGGILADEMGLGKTVELLACILLNAKNERMKSYSNASISSGKPILEKQKKKRKIPKVEYNPDDHANEARTIKVPADWVKKSKWKSKTYSALELWYTTLLSEVSTSSSSRYDNSSDEAPVQCICGSVFEEGKVECDNCGKFQHQACLGYTKKLGRYLCPQCWMDEPLLECGATLIVTPISLRTQWCKEISKHIQGELRVLQYDGFSASPVYPTQFEQYDIVITTYSVLQNELRLTENCQTMNFRRERKYSPPGSPLIRVKWWRLCLDEAQTVETPGRMVSEMASKIYAHYRWAVTGTPISKNISDLHGLIDYLQMTPYNDISTWQHVLYNPYMKGNEEPMINFLSNILWRTAKKDVLDQINIPPQTFKEHILEFSAVEKYFYKREHELCSADFLAKARRLDSSLILQKLDRRVVKQLMAPVLTLRHACTLPNSAKGRYLVTKKHVTSMKDLLDALILKNTTDSEECLRLIISSLNGLAGVHLLLQNPQEAINHYRNVLQFSARFTGSNAEAKLAVDKLQLIHSMYNLAEVIEKHPPRLHTLRDSTLEQDRRELERQYMGKFINETTTAYNTFKALLNNVESIKEKFILKEGEWYSDGLDWIFCHDYYEDVMDKLVTACENANITCLPRSTTERQMLRIMYVWMDDITDLRIKLFTTIDQLYNHDTATDKVLVKQELVEKVMDCHLRPQPSKAKPTRCLFCITDVKLKEYEGKLFNMIQRKKTFEDMSLQGSWKPTQEELIFRSLLALLKSKNGDPSFIHDGELHIKLIEMLKKEFKEVRKFWTFLDQQICAKDELDICKVRLQLKNASNESDVVKTSKIIKNLSYSLNNKLETVHLLSVHELDYQDSFLRNEININTRKLDKLLGTQNYLETLRKQQYEGENPDPCPICKNPLEQHWSILLCGHSYCLECIQVLLEQIMGDNIQCSICRNKQKVQEISYIKSGNTVTDDDCMKIEGNYSTKIEAIIKLLFELKAADPKIKVLLFCSWINILKGLKEALSKNNIKCEVAQSTDLEIKIENFKDFKQNITVLLLPINLGSKGLNLIEATHVILVEPLLNPADEMQAIGRVHRIGQTKPTFVHKFMIKDTIEENLYQATTSNADDWDKHKITVQHLISLFQNGIWSNNTESEDVQEVSESEVAQATLESEEVLTFDSGQQVLESEIEYQVLETDEVQEILESNVQEVLEFEVVDAGTEGLPQVLDFVSAEGSGSSTTVQITQEINEIKDIIDYNAVTEFTHSGGISEH